MTGRIHDKVAIITGAGGGMGEATAIRFAAEGARVVICDIDGASVETVATQIRASGGDALALTIDVTDDAQVQRLVQTAVAQWGRLDILVNNAGVGSGTGLADTSDEEWYRVLDANLKGPFLCSKHGIAAMLTTGGGAVVNVASISSTAGIPNQAVYAPSKGGLLQMTRQMAIEFAQRHIRVNAVSPGTIETPMVKRVLASMADPDSLMDFLLKNHPVGRIGQPVEVANAILFLASDEASFITGANLAVDGGYTAQ